MNELITIIDKLIDEKLEINNQLLRFSFYEVRIKNNVTSKKQDEFIRLAKIKLNNMNYTVYTEGEEFLYEDAVRRVESNEMLIAVKNNSESNTRKIKSKYIIKTRKGI